MRPITIVGNPQMGKGIGWQSQWPASSGQLHCSCWEGEPNYGCRFNFALLLLYNCFISGKDVVSDVSATMAASRDKMTGVLSNAVTSLHRRTGSGRVVIDKKAEWRVCSAFFDPSKIFFHSRPDLLNLLKKSFCSLCYQPKCYHHFFLLKVAYKSICDNAVAMSFWYSCRRPSEMILV